MFADGIALITEDEQQMQHAIQLIDQTFAEWGLEISLKETKAMPLQVEAWAQHDGDHI